MANLLAGLLQGSTLANTRPDCAAMDTSTTAIPAPSATLPTLGGVTLQSGARVLMTALTSGQNNSVYVVTPLHYTSPTQYQLVISHDGRVSPVSNQSGYPVRFDMILIDGGTSAGKLMCYDGSAFEDLSTL